jgi:hypothetical protein
MTTSPDLGIPEIVSQQNQPEISHNEALIMLQALAQGVIDRAINTPPGSPTSGDSYIIGAAPTGAWAGKANKIAIYWSNAWRFVPDVDSAGTDIPIGARHEGLKVWVRDEDKLYVWSGSAWVEFGTDIKPIESLVIALGDETTPLTAGAGKVTFRMPYAFTLTAIPRASVKVAQASGSILTFDINEGGASILSTKLTVDNTAKTSVGAATPAVLSDTSLADDAEMTIDLDQIGDGTAIGGKIVLIGRRT